jgi:hypothetical protein
MYDRRSGEPVRDEESEIEALKSNERRFPRLSLRFFFCTAAYLHESLQEPAHLSSSHLEFFHLFIK